MKILGKTNQNKITIVDVTNYYNKPHLIPFGICCGKQRSICNNKNKTIAIVTYNMSHFECKICGEIKYVPF